jgi:hypothetical protein
MPKKGAFVNASKYSFRVPPSITHGYVTAVSGLPNGRLGLAGELLA